MATFSPPTITTHTSFLPKSPQLSSFKNKTHVVHSSCAKISCKSTNNNDDDNKFQLIQNPKNNTPSFKLLDRRDMLVGLGGMYGAAITLGGEPGSALAAPIAPNVTTCTLTDNNFDGSVGDRCCPPKFNPDKIVDFEFKNYPVTVMKNRRPAHLAMQDPEWLEDYKRATALMKSLPMTDPRSFLQQARVHCAYCDGAYPVEGHPNQRLLVHASWLFASFHRWYLYFFERILGKMINKPDFALPYWNWDHPDGMKIPGMFLDIDSPLYDPNRNVNHLDKVVDLAFDFNGTEHGYSDEKQIQENLLLMRKQMLYVTKPSLFFGAEYRAGEKADPESGAGALESAPHNNVHVWVGNPTIEGSQDMGSLWSAGRDSLFYCHHSNVDRLWSVWRNELPGNSRKDLTDPDYLDASFVFYDENAKPVRVYIRDSFDTERLGYTFEPQELPWLKMKKTPTPTQQGPITDEVAAFPRPLDSVIKTKVDRPKKSRTKDEKEEQEEILVINFTLGMSQRNIKFDVFINDNADHQPGEKTEVKPQFAGSFTSLTHRGGGKIDQVVGDEMGDMKPKKSGLKLAISKLLDDIGASDSDAIQVTIVPKSGTENIVINGISIKFQS